VASVKSSLVRSLSSPAAIHAALRIDQRLRRGR
jgi:hypothetical protein